MLFIAHRGTRLTLSLVSKALTSTEIFLFGEFCLQSLTLVSEALASLSSSCVDCYLHQFGAFEII